MEKSYLFISIISLIISVIFLIRWWSMTSDIKAIRNILSKKTEPQIKKKQIMLDLKTSDLLEGEHETITALKKQMKENQCIVRIKNSEKLVIWNKTEWQDAVSSGENDKNYFLLYANF